MGPDHTILNSIYKVKDIGVMFDSSLNIEALQKKLTKPTQ